MERTGDIKKECDVVIIGAGIGGLTCGSYLAKAGLRTLIVEKHTQPGGYVTSFKRSGFTFDGGAEGLLGCGEGDYLNAGLKELGLDRDLQFVRIDPVELFAVPGMKVAMHANLEKYKEELVKLVPEEKEGIYEFFDIVVAMAEEMRRGGDKVPKNPLEMMKYAMKYPAMTKYYGRKKMSFQQLIDGCVSDFRLKIILGMYSVWIGTPPAKIISPVAAAILYDLYVRGNYYPKGGLQTFSTCIANGFKKAGGTLLLRNAVSKILIVNGRAVGVELENGTRIGAKFVVSNADARQTFLKLVGEEHLDKKFLSYVKELKQSISGILVFLGVDMDLRSYPSHISYGQNPMFLDMLDRIRLEAHDGEIADVIAGPAIRIPSNLDPSHASPGKSCVILLAQAPYNYKNNWMTGPNGERTDAYRALKQEVADKLIRMVENVIPELSKHIVVKDVATPLTFERYTWQYKGGWYGPAMDQELPDRVTPIKGLLLAGSNTVGPGVPRAFTSGKETAQHILKMSQN